MNQSGCEEFQFGNDLMFLDFKYEIFFFESFIEPETGIYLPHIVTLNLN